MRHRHNLRTATTHLCFRLLPVVVNSVRRISKSPSKIWCCNDATRGQSARPGSRSATLRYILRLGSLVTSGRLRRPPGSAWLGGFRPIPAQFGGMPAKRVSLAARKRRTCPEAAFGAVQARGRRPGSGNLPAGLRFGAARVGRGNPRGEPPWLFITAVRLAWPRRQTDTGPPLANTSASAPEKVAPFIRRTRLVRLPRCTGRPKRASAKRRRS